MDGDFAIVKNFELGDFDAHALHARQLQQAVRKFADQGFEKIDMLFGAFVDDDLAHLAVIQNVVNIVVVGQ